MIRFAGFELDERRAELRGPAGAPVKLRPKTFELLRSFATNAGRVLSKEELMQAVWRSVNVSDDSLFQCVRELRAALGDDEHQLIKVVSGRGYLFAAEVSGTPDDAGVGLDGRAVSESESRVPPLAAMAAGAAATPPRSLAGWRRQAVIAGVVALCAIVGLAVAAPTLRDLIFGRAPPTVAVLAVEDVGGDATAIAAAVTDQLADGLARIESFRVVAPEGASTAQADFVLHSQLRREGEAWTLQSRLIASGSGTVQSVVSVSVDAATDTKLLQLRLAAGVGEPLARELNASIEDAPSDAVRGVPLGNGNAKVAIEQATTSINQTSRERFADAQTMLEAALAAEPDNVDVQVALAALQMRGIQMVWYEPAQKDAAESSAKALLERAVKATPRSIPVLQAYCRFLSATNHFAESLVTCARALSFDPWDGSALYLTGLGQLNLGRFEEALATFEEAERYDTPTVSRWTWPLGAGLASVMLGRNEDAVRWLLQSIAITPASGRSYMLLATAYERLGQPDEAKTALAKGVELRPGSTVANVLVPTENSSPRFVEAGEAIGKTLLGLGLPAG